MLSGSLRLARGRVPRARALFTVDHIPSSGSVVGFLWRLLNGDHREPTSAIPIAIVRRDEPALLEPGSAREGRGVRAAERGPPVHPVRSPLQSNFPNGEFRPLD